MDPREQRMAQNEMLFREVNERVRSVAGSHGDDDHLYEFYCECSNIDCTFQVKASLAEYEGVRAHGARFLVVPEHSIPEIETVAERAERWWVVEKHGEAADLAEDADPRG